MNSESQTFDQQPTHEMLKKVLSFFAILWLISGIGVIIGQYVPPSLMLPLIFVELGLLLAMVFIRKKKIVGKTFALIFSLISGITLYPTLVHYVGAIGGEVVLAVFVSTAVLFTLYGLIGYRLNKNLVGWSSYLFMALIGIVVVSIFSIFVPFSSGLTLILSIAGVLLFSLYTIYDFNKIRHQNITEEDVPFVAIGLYLDFLNLFLNILRIVGFFKD